MQRREIPPGIPKGVARLVYWHLRFEGPCCDPRLEVVLKERFGTPPSTVRGARKRLERLRIVFKVGRTRDGHTKWGLTRPAVAEPVQLTL